MSHCPCEIEWYAPLCAVDIGKAIGLLSALHWMKYLHLEHVDFELYSKRVVDSL